MAPHHGRCCRSRNINMTFGGVRALKNVSFEVLPGEVHCLAGENGSGKSTLIKVITGVYQPEAGAVIDYDGQSYSHMSPVTAQAGGIQVIWQDLALFPEMTVAENIAFQTRPRPLAAAGELCRDAPRRDRRLATARRHPRCRPGAAPLSHRPAPDRRDRARPRRRREARLHGRADGVAHPVRNRLSARYRAQAVGRRASPSSSSAIGWRRCWRSPAASPCCATAPWSASIRPRA